MMADPIGIVYYLLIFEKSVIMAKMAFTGFKSEFFQKTQVPITIKKMPVSNYQKTMEI